MDNLNKIIKKHLNNILKENNGGNYMFFSNIEQIKRQCELLLNFDKEFIENLLNNGHDWADDHITVAKENMDQVFDFIMNEKEGEQNNINESEEEIDESKNAPTNPKLWAASKAAAKAKFDVYPSAYANGWAAKHYKSKGGGWRKKTNESINEGIKNYDVYHRTYTSAIKTALNYAEKKGYVYDEDEVAEKIGFGPRKPREGDTNRFSISLKKDDKLQKKSLHIQVYGMKETYELNCYIN